MDIEKNKNTLNTNSPLKKKTFKEKMGFWFRKQAISIKRNYYVVPLAIVMITCLQFLCGLYILSPMFDRIPENYGAFNSIFVFVITLFDVLYCVAYLNYALKKYGTKRPIYMLIIYLVLLAVNVVLLVLIYNANIQNLSDEIINYNNAVKEGSSTDVYIKYIALGQKSSVRIIIQLVLSGISAVAVITAPFVQKALSKVKFKQIVVKDNDEKETGQETK